MAITRGRGEEEEPHWRGRDNDISFDANNYMSCFSSISFSLFLFLGPGLSGPRGRAGKPGTNGTPGIPGINAWKVKVNGTYSSDLLIPPSISGMSAADVHKAIVVQEGDNLRLRCAATGNPKPDIEWRRIDNRPISNGAWEGEY